MHMFMYYQLKINPENNRNHILCVSELLDLTHQENNPYVLEGVDERTNFGENG